MNGPLISTGTYCDTLVDDCLEKPCKNSGTCENVIEGFICHCPPGFEGADCGLDTDDCINTPCFHGGTCVDMVGKYR